MKQDSTLHSYTFKGFIIETSLERATDRLYTMFRKTSRESVGRLLEGGSFALESTTELKMTGGDTFKIKLGLVLIEGPGPFPSGEGLG